MKQIVKLFVTVPEGEADELRQAIGDAGGGEIGNYIHCSFSVKGTGRFKPIDGANPAIGQVGQPEEVTEERIEITVEKSKLKQVIKAIREMHSYEKPAIDIFPLLSEEEL